MLTTSNPQISVCLKLTQMITRTRTVEEIYTTALDALAQGLGVTRSSILLFDVDGVMRFKAYRGLSEGYRRAVEGHTPWTPDTPDPQPIVVADVTRDGSLAPYLPTIQAEGIAAMAFIPLVSLNRVIGKFMLYYDAPHALEADELQVADIIAAQVAFAVERTRAEESARRSEERLRFALDAVAMGTWEWDIAGNSVRWSESLERIHGLPPGSFDGTFASYEREIHPEDRERVLASLRRAISEGVPHDVEYRIVGADGTVRWVEGKGRVEYEDGRPARMSGVCMIVTPRKEAEQARLASAEEAARLKDEFLATLSHELRTPLNAILGWVQMLQNDMLTMDRTRQAIEIIGRNAKLQARLIEDILDVSRIITGKLELERHPLLVPHLIDMAVSDVLPAAKAREIELSRELPDDLPPIEGDPKRLQQVLGNVLANAVKFTPDRGHVRISCAAREGTIVIEVADTGAGIEPEFLPFVFDRFRQADSRSTRKHGGLGLGLAIARHLLEQHGGTINAHSPGAGGGTTVRITLPACALNPLSMGMGQQHERVPAAAGRLKGRTVLVVDDQRDARELLAALFEQYGATVCQSDSAAGALHALEISPVDLLVADIAMPDVDGYDLMRRVLRTRGRMPAIAVSAYARPEDRIRALAAGYRGYCAKPIDADDLLSLAAALLRE